jgi:uncharacterized RDD family membrane protein YckC
MEWHYIKDGRQLGPVPETSIRAWLESGFLRTNDLLWRSGLTEWTPVHELPEFGGRGPQDQGWATGPIFAAPGDPSAANYPPPAGARAFAGFWMRLGAYLIDSLLLSTVLVIALWPEIQRGMTPEQLSQDYRLLAAELFLPWLYFALMESSPWQATLGKKAFRLRVTDLEGQRINLGRATLRHLGKILSGLTLFLGYVMAGFTVRKQALHDILAGCLVVRN